MTRSGASLYRYTNKVAFLVLHCGPRPHDGLVVLDANDDTAMI